MDNKTYDNCYKSNQLSKTFDLLDIVLYVLVQVCITPNLTICMYIHSSV